MSKLDRNPVKTTITNLTRKARTIAWTKKPLWLEPGQGVLVDYDVFTEAEGAPKEVLMAEIAAGHVAITLKMTDQLGREFNASYCKPIAVEETKGIPDKSVAKETGIQADKSVKLFDPATGKPKELMGSYLKNYQTPEDATIVTPVSKELLSKGFTASTQYVDNVISLNNGKGIHGLKAEQPESADTSINPVKDEATVVPPITRTEPSAETDTVGESVIAGDLGTPGPNTVGFVSASASASAEVIDAMNAATVEHSPVSTEKPPEPVSAVALLTNATNKKAGRGKGNKSNKRGKK